MQLHKDLRAAYAAAGVVPEMAFTRQLSRAWGFSVGRWAEWWRARKIPGAVKDVAGEWRLPEEAAREQFERALGRDVPLPKSTAHPSPSARPQEVAMSLEHLDPDCTGWWRAERVDGVPHVRCTRCRTLHENTGGITFALVMEGVIDELAEDGRRLLDDERS
jgi:hypothetical protein